MSVHSYKNTDTIRYLIVENLDGFMLIKNVLKTRREMYVDVMLLTKNSASRLRESLQKVPSIKTKGLR